MNFDILKIGASVSTTFGVIGLVIVSIPLAYYLYLRNKEKNLRAIDPSQRAEAYDTYLSRYKLQTKNLAPERVYELIKLELEKRSRITVLIIIVLFLLTNSCLIVALLIQNKSPYTDPKDHIQPGDLTEAERQILDSTQRAAIKFIDYGKYSQEEDARLEERIKNANTIDIIAYNGDGLFSGKFSESYKIFFAKTSSSMRILFDTPGSSFAKENIDMTLKQYNPPFDQPIDYDADSRNAASNLNRLRSWSNGRGLQFEYYNTQLRMPIILIDNNYCIVTVRLPPDEGEQSLRLEVDEKSNTSGKFISSCRNHFARMWQISGLNQPDIKK